MAFTENPTNWPDIVDECQEAGVSCCHGDALYQYHPSSHFYRTICYCNHVITWIPTFNSSLFNITVKFYFVVHPPHSNTSGCISLLNIVHHSTMWTNTKVIRPTCTVESVETWFRREGNSTIFPAVHHPYQRKCASIFHWTMALLPACYL